MQQDELEKLRYPIGQYEKAEQMSEDQRQQCIHEIAVLPPKVSTALSKLTDDQLDTPYRPGGWTVRQVVHHLADSHMNGFIRLKLMLTEEFPTIKPYREELWAELPDGKTMPVESSLQILEGVHKRWAHALGSITELDLSRKYYHPQYVKEVRMDEYLGLYAWHGSHHLAHIVQLKEHKGW